MSLEYVKGLYIHFPFCLSRCSYCDFYSSSPGNSLDSKVAAYEEALDVSKKRHLEFLESMAVELKALELETIYVGGGTPSLWGPERFFSFLSKYLCVELPLSRDIEFTIEANPGTTFAHDFDNWMRGGINRFSVGVQSLDDRFLKLIGRAHLAQDVFRVLDRLSSAGANYSLDFMIGLPQSERLGRSVVDEIKKTLPYNPKHFSVYILTPSENYIHKDLLPTEEFIEREYLTVCSFLEQQGFKQYEVSNFAMSGYESMHNVKYWNGESVAALGASATGFLKFRDHGIRYKWNDNGPNFDIEKLTTDELLLEKVYLFLRTSKGLDLNILKAEKRYIMMQLVSKWKARDLCFVEGSQLFLSSKGFLVMDSLMDQLFSESII